MGYQFNPITNKLDLVGSGGSATTDASLLTTGTLADARLSSNVSLDNINNSFSVGQTITAAANTSALTASYSVTGTNTTPLLDLSGTWNTTGVARGILLNVTDTASASTSRLLDLQVGGTSRFTVLKSGQFSTPSDLYTNSAALTGGVRIALNSTLGFTLSSNPAVNPDTILARDAANTLALRNGGTAASPVPQTFRLYNYTDVGLTNFERGFMRWNSNVLEIGTEAGGTGTARAFDLYSAGILGARIRGNTYATFYVGLEWTFSSQAADPTTSDVPSTRCRVIKNTTTGNVKLWVNDGGTLKSVALA
jgi:hypothetical protein